MFIKLWYIQHGYSTYYQICNVYRIGHCLDKNGSGDNDLSCPADLKAGDWNLWKFTPVFSKDFFTWNRVYAMDNTNNPEPINREGRL